MTDVTHKLMPGSERPTLWERLVRFGAHLARRGPVNAIDPDSAPADLLRDIGLCDGRGPSLRRPERGF